MWTWSLNWAEVRPRLIIGTCPMRPPDLKRIHAETRATAILSVQHDECLAYWGIDEVAMRAAAVRLGLRTTRRPMRDFDIHDQQRHLPAAVAALAGLQAARARTYVHCTAGLGRAPLTVLAYLTWVEGWPEEAAIQAIRAVRPAAVPSWEAFRGARGELVTRHRSAIAERAYRIWQERQAGAGDAEADWRRAEVEVFREVLSEANG